MIYTPNECSLFAPRIAASEINLFCSGGTRYASLELTTSHQSEAKVGVMASTHELYSLPDEL